MKFVLGDTLKIGANTLLVLLVNTCLLVGLAYSEEAVITLRSTVKGNQEQPKVLYILPWQKAESIEWNYQPTESVIDDVFNPVDRDEFIRELKYRKLLKPKHSDKSAM